MKTEGPLEPALPARNPSSLLLLTATPQAPSHRPSLQRPTPKPSSPFKMAKLTGSSNYKASEVSRLLVLVSKHLPLGKDEWERLVSHFNVNRVRGEADRDYESLRRKFKMLYSTRKPTGVQEMPPHIREAKLLKKAIDNKANVVVMDDGGDEDDQVDEEREIEPDFCFNFDGDESFESEGDNAGFTGTTSTDSETKSSSSAVADVRRTDETVNLSADTVSLPSTEVSCDFSALLETAAVRDGLDAFATSANLPPVAVRSSVRLRSAGIKKPFKSSSPAPITCTTVNAPTGGTAGLAKKPVGRSRDQAEAQRYPKLVSASNRLGGLNLAEFRDTVGRKRASENDDE
ncbi:hypothetical protein PF001_g25351 [Phytophthora fragariae]|uniref:DUF6818 domain-containing protein n=1 Tax=Phytophthora fragariae TaxID=53985 RepID=A0A6A4BP10_9STRA|nr:hypothetical protein PF001_g25351 [Phytophthora fragariae]